MIEGTSAWRATEAELEWANGDDGAVDELPIAPPRWPYDPVVIGQYVLRMNGFLVTTRNRWGQIEIVFFSRPRRWPYGDRLPSNWVVCPECDDLRTPEGHDPCIAHLGGVAYACCGHGDRSEEYVATVNGRSWHGPGSIRRWAEWLRTSEGRVVSEMSRQLAVALWWVPYRTTGLSTETRLRGLLPRGRHAACQLPHAECTCGVGVTKQRWRRVNVWL